MYPCALIFSHQSYDLSAAFAILRAALYHSLNSLHDEIQARIVQEMLHCLCRAFIPFEEYGHLTDGRRVREVVDTDNVLDEFHVFWSLLWPMMFRINVRKVDLDVPLLVFSVKVGFIKNSLHCIRKYAPVLLNLGEILRGRGR
jgi:hypothetical protein